MTIDRPFVTATQLHRHRFGAEASNICDTSTTALSEHESPSIPNLHHADWLEDFACLLARFSGLGVESDIRDMVEDELMGVYRFLQRKAMIHDERMRSIRAGSR